MVHDLLWGIHLRTACKAGISSMDLESGMPRPGEAGQGSCNLGKSAFTWSFLRKTGRCCFCKLHNSHQIVLLSVSWEMRVVIVQGPIGKVSSFSAPLPASQNPPAPLSLSAISPSPAAPLKGHKPRHANILFRCSIAKSLVLKHGGLCPPACPGMQERVWLSVLLVPAWHQPRSPSATGHLSVLTGQLLPTHRNVLQEVQVGLNVQYVGLGDSLVPLTSVCACGEGMACIAFLPSKGLTLWLKSRNNTKGQEHHNYLL